MKKELTVLTIIALLLTSFVSCNGDVDEKMFNIESVVTFVSNGGSEVESQVVKNGTCATKPTEPTFGDYDFTGWYLKDSSEEYNFNTPVNEDITLYAHWEGVVETKIKKGEITLTQENKIEVETSPISTTSDNKKTVIQLPANAISGTKSTSELSVTSYSIEVAPIAFTILETVGTQNNLAVAGIDCTLKIDDQVVSDFNAPVTVTTYIPKSLGSVQVVYKGDDGKAQPIAKTDSSDNKAQIFETDTEMGDKLGYSKESGMLRFSTTHFSEFYVATNAEVCIVDDSDLSDISAMTLAEFRNNVNTGNTYEGYTVTLLKDVDLKNEEWTPIGTTDKPFSGVFDGDGHTVSNLKITTYTSSNGVGLFGNLVGDESLPNQYTDVSQVWNNNVFNLDFFAENKYSARVVNINVNNFEVSSTKDYTGTVVGYAKNAYVSNVFVANGTITAPGKLGGVVGATGRNMVIKDLVTDSSVTIVGTKHSVGGIIGGFNRGDGSAHAVAAINCVNNAPIINNSDGVIGGIVGNLGSTSGLCGFVYNCTNNGNISLNNNGGNMRAGGILGDGLNTKVIVNCINNGSIDVVSTKTGWYVGGINANTSSGGTIFYNCVNNGDITAFAQRLAGITALEKDGSEITNCENNGLLVNTNPDGAVYELTGGHYSIQTYEASSTPMSDIAAVNSKIDDSFAIYNFKGYGEIDGELVIDSTKSYVTINADSRICSTVSIQNTTTQTIILDIPGISCTVSGDMSGLTLVLKGEGSQFVLSEGAKILSLQLEGNNSSATIKGEISQLKFSGENNVSAEITSTGKCQRVSFSGNGHFTLTNRGLISCTCHNEWGTSHVVTTQSPCTITINNYGTIESKTGEYGRCAYALLFYSGCDVVFNAYSGSCLQCDMAGYVLACWSSNSVKFNYESGAQLFDGSVAKQYSSISGSKVTVNSMN